MKKHILLGSVLLLATSILSQTANSQKQTGSMNAKLISDTKYILEEIPSDKINSVKPTALPVRSDQKNSSTSNWQSFTSSMDINGVTHPYCKPLQWNDELDAITFIHNKSTGYNPSPTPALNAASGAMVVHVTLNCGNHWDSTALYANDTHWGRYPGGAIYNPPSTPMNTNINNTYFVGTGPTVDGIVLDWSGNFYASKQLGTANYDTAPSIVSNAVQIIPQSGPFPPNIPGSHRFASVGFTATDDGKMRVMAFSNNAGFDTDIILLTATFNNGVFDWAGQVFSPPVTVTTNGKRNLWAPFLMAWNELGTIGYIVTTGSKSGASASNVGMQPIVYKTTNSGSTWSLENGINFNASDYSDVIDRLEPVNSNPTLKIPNFTTLEGMDCSVDANNKLHIFCTLTGHVTSNLDSLGLYNEYTPEHYLWRHTPGRRPYLFDFIYDGTNPNPTWSHLLIDSMSTQGTGDNITTGGGYQDNPWDVKMRLYARLQMSRTPDGQHLLYSWTESDTAYTTNQKKWNTLPNIKVRLYDVTANVLSPTELDLTSNDIPNVASRAMFHFVSPKFKLISKTSTTITAMVPMTLSNSNPYAAFSENTHWFSCSPLSFANTSTLVEITENSLSRTNSSSIFPNPTKNNVTVNLNLLNTSAVQIEVLNTIGQLIKTSQSQGQTGVNSIQIDLRGLSSGIYFVNIKVDGRLSTKKLIIE